MNLNPSLVAAIVAEASALSAAWIAQDPADRAAWYESADDVTRLYLDCFKVMTDAGVTVEEIP